MTVQCDLHLFLSPSKEIKKTKCSQPWQMRRWRCSVQLWFTTDLCPLTSGWTTTSCLLKKLWHGQTWEAQCPSLLLWRKSATRPALIKKAWHLVSSWCRQASRTSFSLWGIFWIKSPTQGRSLNNSAHFMLPLIMHNIFTIKTKNWTIEPLEVKQHYWSCLAECPITMNWGQECFSWRLKLDILC